MLGTIIIWVYLVYFILLPSGRSNVKKGVLLVWDDSTVILLREDQWTLSSFSTFNRSKEGCTLKLEYLPLPLTVRHLSLKRAVSSNKCSCEFLLKFNDCSWRVVLVYAKIWLPSGSLHLYFSCKRILMCLRHHFRTCQSCI